MARKEIVSTVTGIVWKVEAAAGAAVPKEGVLLVIESMKMEIPVMAPTAGTVVEILVGADDVVDEGQAVAIMEV